MQLDSVDLLPYMVNRLNSRLNSLWLKQIRGHGLTTPRWQILSVLSAFDGCRVTVLAEMCGSEQPVISRVVDQMQRDGLVERRPARDDSRAVEVWLCEKGRGIHRELLPAAKGMITELTAGFSKVESKQVMGLLGRLLESAEGINTEK